MEVSQQLRPAGGLSPVMLNTIKNHSRTFRDRLLQGLAWNAFGAVSLQGSNLLVTAILIYILGLSQFGAYQLIVSTLFMIANFAQGGCAFVATKIIAENIDKDRARVSAFLSLFSNVTMIAGLVAAAAVIGLAPLICTRILGRPELLNELYIASVSVIFQISFTYRTGALQGFSAFRALGQTNAFSGLMAIVFIAAGAYHAQLEGALVGYALAQAFRSLACFITLRQVRRKHDIPIDCKVATRDYRTIWHLALPAGLAGLVTVPALWGVNLAISRLPDGLALVGIFAIIHQIRQAALYFPTLLNAVSFSVSSRLLGAGTRNEAKAVFSTNVVLNAGFGLIMAIILFAFAPQILGLWKISSPPGIYALRLLALSLVPELAATSVYQLVQSSGLMWRSLFQIALPRDLLLCILSVMLLPQFGLAGAAGAYLFAHIIGLVMTIITARQAHQRVFSYA
jgi:O-antigen/teichoic acid export membrane protein